jgi:hypothetical protein
MTTHPSSSSTFAMSAGEEPEPTVHTAAGGESELIVCIAADMVHTVQDSGPKRGRSAERRPVDTWLS